MLGLGEVGGGQDRALALAVGHPDRGLVPRGVGQQRQEGRGGHVLEVAADRESQLLAPEAAPRDLGPAVHLAGLEEPAQQPRRVAQQLALRAEEGAPVHLAAQLVLELDPLAQHEEVAQHQRRRVLPDHRTQARDGAGHQVVVGVQEPDVVPARRLQRRVARAGEPLVLRVEQPPHAHRPGRVRRHQFAHQRVGAVGGAVVHHQHLDAVVGLGQHRVQALAQVVLDVVDGNQHRQPRRVGAGVLVDARGRQVGWAAHRRLTHASDRRSTPRVSGDASCRCCGRPARPADS